MCFCDVYGCDGVFGRSPWRLIEDCWVHRCVEGIFVGMRVSCEGGELTFVDGCVAVGWFQGLSLGCSVASFVRLLSWSS